MQTSQRHATVRRGAGLAAPPVLAAGLALGCGSSPQGTPKRPGPVSTAPTGPAYRATIRWTSHGIPHVTATDLGGLAYGQGYAFATLHVCTLADQIVKLR